MQISLLQFPGRGHFTVEVDPGDTLGDLLREQGFENNSIQIEGESIPPSRFDNIHLTEGMSVFVGAAVKGA